MSIEHLVDNVPGESVLSSFQIRCYQELLQGVGSVLSLLLFYDALYTREDGSNIEVRVNVLDTPARIQG